MSGPGQISRSTKAPGRALAFVLLAILAAGRAGAASPPNTPPITSPLSGSTVSPFDVHMEAGPFSDPDPSSSHSCTDWEIWSLTPLERVWVTSCITGVERLHTHLGDGTFENSLAGATSLAYNNDYKLRVRFMDNTGLWSGWAELPFFTGSQSSIFPMLTNDVASGATWKDESGISIILPAGATQPKMRVESGAGSLLLQMSGNNGTTNTVTNPSALASDVAIRVMFDGGSPGISIPLSRIVFTDPVGVSHTIYLPAVNLGPSAQAFYWVSTGGATYVGTSSQTDPDFSTLARASLVPWTVYQPGYEVEIVATGFQLPVNIAFIPNPGPNPGDPFYYVTELYGKIKMVTRDGTVSNYATNLLNFNPTGSFPGSGEQGLAGIAVDPTTGDVFAGLLYDAAPPNGPHYPKVMRFHSTDGGRTAATQTTILSMPGEDQGQSHFISNLSIGPADARLYVHMGDGFDFSTALNLDSFRGKILRLNLDGSAPTDNPLYNAGNGINSRDYIYAYGFRNPFGGAWRAADGKHYEVENGNNVNDRFARVLSGASYGWDGSDQSMTISAIYNWASTVAPVNMAFVQASTFGGSQFPTTKYDHAFVTISGPTYAPGTNDSKAIVEFQVDGSGGLMTGPNMLIQYNGTGQASAAGLAAGPDGLYFTDLYKDQGAATPIDPGANVLRVKFKGLANFSATIQRGAAPLTTNFSDLSQAVSISSWFWEFGDGQTSTTQNPSHTYTSDGAYDVKLTLTAANGTIVGEKSAYIVVGQYAPGLLATYFDDMNLSHSVLSRIDPTVNFDWAGDSPAAQVPSDGFSARWIGEVQPQFTQTYTFYTNTDDGVRLWVNNQQLVNQWNNQPPIEYSGNISLTAGTWYPIKMEYFEGTGGAVAQLSWQSAGQPKEIIPSARLRTTNSVTGVEITPAPLISRVTLFPSAPNPARVETRLAFAVPQTGHATLRIFNARGALVATVFDAEAEGQRVYRLPFGVEALASGIYFERLETKGMRITKKLVVLR